MKERGAIFQRKKKGSHEEESEKGMEKELEKEKGKW